MGRDEEYTGPTGDPLHDAVYGWDLGSGSSDGDEGGSETQIPIKNIKIYLMQSNFALAMKLNTRIILNS